MQNKIGIKSLILIHYANNATINYQFYIPTSIS